MNYQLEDFTERFELELTTVPLVVMKGDDVEQATLTLMPLIGHNILMHKAHEMRHMDGGDDVLAPLPVASVYQTFGPYPYYDPVRHLVAPEQEVYILLVEVKTPWKLDVEETLSNWGMAPIAVEYEPGEEDE